MPLSIFFPSLLVENYDNDWLDIALSFWSIFGVVLFLALPSATLDGHQQGCVDKQSWLITLAK